MHERREGRLQAPLFATLFLAGLRPGEARALTPDRVDFAGKAITVDRQLSTHTGLTTTKTGGSRKVDLSDALAGILTTVFTPRLDRPKVVSIAAGVTDTTTSSGAPWPLAQGVSATPTAHEVAAAYRSALRAFSRSLKRAGVAWASTATVGRADGFGLHTGRHSFATALISAGVSPAYVQQQLGHSDVSLTVRVYGSHFPARVPGGVDAVAIAFTGGVAGQHGHSRQIGDGGEQLTN